MRYGPYSGKQFGTLMIGVLIAALALIATGCEHENTSAKSDETVCVFDGSESGSQKLKYQIFPGQEPREADSDDEVVRIPTSFRFYAAFKDRQIADAGAPSSYIGYARGNTPVNVQGSLKFRFLVDNACEWYARHGRRNAKDGSLGFNARSDEAASDFSPWVRWLNENFGTVAAATIKSSTVGFTWPELVYGNDEAAPERSGPVDIVYGKFIGRRFAERLDNSLGGHFFCGTDANLWAGDPGINKDCPPIFFETGAINTKNPALETERENIEALRAQLANAAVEAEIREKKLQSQIKDQNTQQKLLSEEVNTARLEALKKPEVQKCIIFARAGLDCDGRHPQRIILGASTR